MFLLFEVSEGAESQLRDTEQRDTVLVYAIYFNCLFARLTEYQVTKWLPLVSASGDVPIRRLEPHPLADPTAAFQWSEIFYDGMTHKNTHSLSHPNTPVSRNNNHHLEGNTTMGDTERRQPNAA